MKRKGRTKFFIVWLLVAALTLPPFTGVAEANYEAGGGKVEDSGVTTADQSDYGIAIGANSVSGTSVVGNHSIAIGYAAKVGVRIGSHRVNYGLSIGNYTAVNADYGVAFGNYATANGISSNAIGERATASGLESIAFGKMAITSGDQGIAMGSGATAEGLRSSAIGTGAGASAEDSIAMGSGAKAEGDRSYAFGTGAKAGAFAEDSIAMGSGATAEQRRSSAFGKDAKASGIDSIAMGTRATAEGIVSAAFGYEANASEDQSIAIGTRATAEGDRSSAFGLGAKASKYGSIAMGSDATAEGYSSSAIGTGAKASGTDSIAFGSGAIAHANNNVIAIGTNAEAEGNDSISIGYYAKTSAEGSIAVGSNASTFGMLGTAVGNGANAYEWGTALGNSSNASSNATAVGYHAKTDSNGTALGYYTEAYLDSTALGYQAQAPRMYGVALGARSYSDRGITTSGIYVPSGAVAGNVTKTVIGAEYGGGYGVVSIGDPYGHNTNGGDAFTRQLIGLAAGVEDTDAVNVAQLKALDSITVRYTSADAKNEIILGNGGNTASINKLTAKNLDGKVENKDYAATTGQVYNVGDSAAKKLGSTFSLGTDGTVNGTFSFNGVSGIATVQDALTAVDNIAVKYYDSGKTSVALGNAGTPVKLTNVVSGDSGLDAVNFSQLTETNKMVDTVSGDLGNLKDAVKDISDNLGGFAVTYDDEHRTQISLGEKDTPVALKNVLAGTEDLDAVNYAQLKTVSADVEDNANRITTLDGIAVKYEGTDKKSIRLGEPGTTVKLTNVADGAIKEGSTEAVTGGQLFKTNSNIETLSKDVSLNTKDIAEIKGNIGTVSGDMGLLAGRVTTNENKITSHDQQLTDLEGDMSNIKSAITYTPDNNSIRFGEEGTPVRLTNVADGVTSNDAVNVKQLTDVSEELNTKIEELSIGVDEGSVRYGEGVKNKLSFMDVGNSVKIYNVAEGEIKADSTDAVNGGQLFQIYEKYDKLGNSIADRLGGTYDETTGEFDILHPQGPSTGNTASDSSSTTGNTGSTGGTQTFADGDPTLNATLQKMWDAIDSKTMTAGDNITVEGDKISVSKNPEFESIKVGNINIREEGINMGGNTITGLANGGIYQGSSDAVTGDQLWNAYRRIDTIDERVQVVGAHAAALSALHPVPYNPYEPTTFSAGFGIYRNEQSVAVGVFHYVRENVLVNAGFSLNSDGDTMGRAGISFAIGKSGRKQPSMIKDVASMQQQMVAMQQMLVELKEENEKNKETILELKEENKENKETIDRNEKTITELKKALEKKK